ncbi:hypothetical protein VTK73DRAFT_10290 [Phialemonium thermophilum]|uniref:Cyanovirin-N domain-containing protein n=1 Tax=Phialemonium thermophilum TaxID=223376 RepID=A0ABR3VXG8_9PEZI
MPSSTQTFVVAAATAIASAAASPTPYANFTQTCRRIELLPSRLQYNDTLTASCRLATAPGNQTRDSSIDLNLCVGIDYQDAHLTWSIYGKYVEYCTSCSLAPPAVMSCTCTTLAGVSAQSSLDLDTGIRNDGGVLSCMGGIGS